MDEECINAVAVTSEERIEGGKNKKKLWQTMTRTSYIRL